jgi:general secretion pathway protein N
MNLRVSRGLTFGLACLAALMLLLVALFWFGVGRGYSWWPRDPQSESANNKKFANAQFRLGNWDNFAEVNTRPLFNEDRKPTPPMPSDGGGDQKSAKQLDLVLSGVIITPDIRMAMLKEKGKEKAMTVKEGGNLPGDWDAWSLAELKPRKAVFKNSAGDSETVELIPVATSQKSTPPPPSREVAPAQSAQKPAAQPGQPSHQPPAPGHPAPQTPAQPGTQAATDLQQRIDARRQQIREQQQPQAQPAARQQ